MPSIAKNQGLWSAAKVIRSGGSIVSGEFVTDIQSSDGQTSTTGGVFGHINVFTSKEGLQSTAYASRLAGLRRRRVREAHCRLACELPSQSAFGFAAGNGFAFPRLGEGTRLTSLLDYPRRSNVPCQLPHEPRGY